MLVQRLVGLGALALAVQFSSVEAQTLTELVSPAPATTAFFGHDVATFGDLAVVGAPYIGGGNSGAVYTFARTGPNQWQAEATVLEPSPSTAFDDFYGFNISFIGDLLAVGAPGGFQPGQGAVYLYRREAGAWVQEARLSGESSRCGFGASVRLYRSRLIVGEQSSGVNLPRAYFYQRDATGGSSGGPVWNADGYVWMPADDGQNNPGDYGEVVAIEGNIAMVGASQADPREDPEKVGRPGVVYVYERRPNETNCLNGTGPWCQVQRILYPEDNCGNTFHHFGRSIEFQGNQAIIGAHRGKWGANCLGSGIAYPYQRNASGEWVKSTQELVPQNAVVGMEYSFGLSMRNGIALVGVHGIAPGAFEIHVLTGNHWNLVGQVSGPAGADRFGWALDLNTYAAIGAPRSNQEAGRAFMAE